MERFSHISRRGLFAGTGAAILSLGLSHRSWAAAHPFTLGVASGSPTPAGIVLWTRLAPEPLSPDPDRPGGMPASPVPVRWEIAEDEAMAQITRSGTVDALPEFAHAVHVEVRDLAAGRPYWYRFIASGETSPIGRTRTAPTAGSSLDRLRFAFASCSHYELGWFSAYRHLAAENPDLVLFLGDYIYEFVSQFPQKVRHHSDGVEATDLRTYRNRYAQYRTDPDLQAVHATAPCIATWDDHEVQNDYADKWSQTFDAPEVFLARRAAAYRAFWEHMPLPPSALPQGPNAALYGRFGFGDLATFFVLDGRQYKSRLACDAPPKGGGKQVVDGTCPDRLDAARSYLGITQEKWLYDQFHTAPSHWNLIAQGQLMAELKERLDNGAIAHWTEDWNGYPAARQRLLEQMRDSRLPNPVVMGGDIHSFWANDLKANFDDPNAPVVATEFVGTSITSPGPPYAKFAQWASENPHIRFFDSRKRGYVSVDLRRDRMDVAFRAISDPVDPQATLSTLAQFSVPDGKPGVTSA